MNLPTIEELDRIGYDAAGWPKRVHREFDDQVARYIAAIRDAVVSAYRPQLRPIAEMPAEVPEGCVRVFASRYFEDQRWIVLGTRYPEDTHYIDIALPVEAYPADFEQAFAESKLDAKNKHAAFKLWKGGAR